VVGTDVVFYGEVSVACPALTSRTCHDRRRVECPAGRQDDHRTRAGAEKIPGHGHALIIDSGWREVADTALAFVKRFT
jgi:hypothetical protein